MIRSAAIRMRARRSGSRLKCPGCGGKTLAVAQRRCNHSAFNGHRYTPSRYSEIWCKGCGRSWRTKADVSHLQDLR